jgi:DNA-binding transcriptional MerR regulator
MPHEPATVTTALLAKELGVHRNTVINWVRTEFLVPDHVTTLGYARWRPSSVRRIRRQVQARAA